MQTIWKADHAGRLAGAAKGPLYGRQSQWGQRPDHIGMAGAPWTWSQRMGAAAGQRPTSESHPQAGVEDGAVVLRLEFVLPAEGIEDPLKAPFPGEIVDVCRAGLSPVQDATRRCCPAGTVSVNSPDRSVVVCKAVTSAATSAPWRKSPVPALATRPRIVPKAPGRSGLGWRLRSCAGRTAAPQNSNANKLRKRGIEFMVAVVQANKCSGGSVVLRRRCVDSSMSFKGDGVESQP